MKLLLIVNASASSVTERARVVIQKALSADHELTMAETTRKGHATRLARTAASEGMDAVIVLGGDGTLNEAANGLAGTKTALGALPGGSTNVFARTIGMTNDPIEATGKLLHAIARGSVSRIGLGKVDKRYFLFSLGMGFDAAVVAQVEKRSQIKRYASHLFFVMSSFMTWFRHFDRSRPRMSLNFDDGTEIADAYYAIAVESDPYTFLGSRPLSIAADADLNLGLAVLAIRTPKLFATLSVVMSALRGDRRIRQHRRVDYKSDIHEVIVKGYGSFPYQVDGEYLGETDKIVIRHEPDVLNLLIP